MGPMSRRQARRVITFWPFDGQVKSNADNISTNTSNIASNATDIRNLKDLSNITADGQTVIKNLAKDAVKVVAGTNTTVTEGTDGDAKTYAVNVADADIKKPSSKILMAKQTSMRRT